MAIHQSSDLSSGADSSSPHETEAPPAFAPLGADDSNTVANSRANEDRKGEAMSRCSSSNQRHGVVQVDFPPDFDASRKGSDSDDSGKTRGGSLGTKSGSTSLLSMLSGSPRSLATPRDSAAGSPSPRTPLSDRSSCDATAGRAQQDVGRVSDAGGAITTATASTSAAAHARAVVHEPWSSHGGADADRPSRSRSSSARGSQPRSSPQQERLPEVAVNGDEEDDETDLPSAHPTPLSSFGAGMDLPSDHPTPLSTQGSLRSRKPGSAAAATAGNNSNGAAGGSRKSAKTPSSSFMQRLKYWGGGGGEGNAKARSPAVPTGTATPSTARDSNPIAAKATREGSAKARSPAVPAGTGTPSTVRGSNPIAAKATSASAAFAATVTIERAPTGEYQSDRSSTAGGGETPATSAGGGRTDATSPSVGAEMSPAELRGVKVMPYDSVTSDSASAYQSSQLWRATASAGKPSSAIHREGSAVGAPTRRPSRSPSSRHRKADSQEVPGLAPLVASVSKSSKSPQSASSTPAVSIPAALAIPARSPAAPADTSSSSSGVRKYGGFGAAHRKELADLRRARGSPTEEDEDVEEEEDDEVKAAEEEEEEEEEDETESEMDWDAVSDEEGQEEKKEEIGGPLPPLPLTMAEKVARFVTPRGRGLGLGPSPVISPPAVAPPRYMALVEEATVTSALDSSTSEQDTSPSEDDGGMMAEILTDRLMEVCSKMEAAAAPPADELSDGGGGDGGKRRSIRRRMSSNMSSVRTFSKDQVWEVVAFLFFFCRSFYVLF